jgi:hypothetical protein
MKQSVPLSARSLLGGVAGSVLDVYTGEYEFDNYTVKLHQNRGADNGVVISYAKNLTGVKCEERLDGVITGVLGYWVSQDEFGGEQKVFGDLQSLYTDLSYSRNIVVDFSSEFETKPTKDQLNARSQKYIDSHKNVPYFSVSVEFVNLGDTEEYKEYKGLYRVGLCDTVTVKHPIYGISVKAKVVKTVFDCVREKYKKIEIGEASSNISQTIVAQEKAISEKVTFSQLDKAVLNATNAIINNKGGYVVLNPPSSPQELLILDKPNINEATNVWRWNLAGLGHSGSGYNGKFSTAITADGQIVADFITSGKLSANVISSGVISSMNNSSYFSLDTGEAQFGGESYYTKISSGFISQYYEKVGKAVGGFVPVGTETEFSQAIFYTGNEESIVGVGIYRKDDKGFASVCNFSLEGNACLKTNVAREDVPYAITHHRKSTFNGVETEEQINIGISKTKEDERACICLEHGQGGRENAQARLDIYKSTGEGYGLITLVGCSLGEYSKQLTLGTEAVWCDGAFVAKNITCDENLFVLGEAHADKLSASDSITAGGYILASSFGNKENDSLINGVHVSVDATDFFNVTARTGICLGTENKSYVGYKVLVEGNLRVENKIYCEGDVSGATITNRSDRKIKKNIKSTNTKNALSTINSLSVYDYDLKDTGESVKMGLMADEAPSEILSDDGTGINLYSYCGMLALAVKELSEKVDKIEKNGGNYGRKD